MFRSLTCAAFLAVAAVTVSGAAGADTLTVYTAGPKSLAEKLAAGYEQATGTKVDLFQATTGKVMARLEAEESNPVADVLVSASWGSALDLEKRGLLMAYSSPNAKTVPDFLKADTYVAQGVSALAIAWNSRSGTPKPADWSDLARPEYRDMVTMPDPAQSGSAYDLVAGLQSQDEPATWKLLGDLKANGIIVPGANAQALNPVLQGARGVVFGAVDYISLGAAAKGESIEVVFPKSGTVVAPRPMMILKSARNPDAARKFIDYVLSDEGQSLVADVFLMPARADLPARRPTISELKVIDLDPDAAAAGRAGVLEKFKTTMAD